MCLCLAGHLLPKQLFVAPRETSPCILHVQYQPTKYEILVNNFSNIVPTKFYILLTVHHVMILGK
jgi:hypothetical protein